MEARAEDPPEAQPDATLPAVTVAPTLAFAIATPPAAAAATVAKEPARRTLTDEQKTIVKRAGRGETLRILALAGTGKTSTLAAIARVRQVPTLYLAFNTAIAAEARRKFPKHVKVKTGHALAMDAFGRKLTDGGRLENNGFAIRQAMQAQFSGAIAAVGGSARANNSAYVVYSTLCTFMNSASEEISLRHVPPDATGVSPLAVVRAARQIFTAMTDPDGAFPVSHDAYFKAWVLTKPQLPFAVIYGDEWQDSSPVMLAFMESQTHAQRIYVGDSSQSIYGFRGAVNALAALDKLPAYPLTQSFRFGTQIARVANSILRAKEEPLRVRGLTDIDDTIEEIDVPDLVLARTNAGLFEEAVRTLDRLAPNERIYFVGGVAEVVGMAKAAFELCSSGKTSHQDFRFFKNWVELEAIVESKQADKFGPFVKLVKTHGDRIPAMGDALLAAAVTEERKARVVFSTAHTFKGREKPRVRLANDFPEFCRYNRVRRRYEFCIEEANIAYVAVTRAQHALDIKSYLPMLLSSIANKRDHLPGPLDNHL